MELRPERESKRCSAAGTTCRLCPTSRSRWGCFSCKISRIALVFEDPKGCIPACCFYLLKLQVLFVKTTSEWAEDFFLERLHQVEPQSGRENLKATGDPMSPPCSFSGSGREASEYPLGCTTIFHLGRCTRLWLKRYAKATRDHSFSNDFRFFGNYPILEPCDLFFLRFGGKVFA